MKKYKKAITLAAIAVVLIYLFGLFVKYYADWLWFNNMGYSSVFDTMILSRAFSFIVFFVIFALFAGVNLRIAYKRGSQSRYFDVPGDDDPRKMFLPLHKGKAAIRFWGILIIFVGILMGSLGSSHWNDFLQLIHSSSFNLKEPVFGKDAGFYIFRLPVYQFAT
jgi:uncharacterized membrane protein (UPF0182 family)